MEGLPSGLTIISWVDTTKRKKRGGFGRRKRKRREGWRMCYEKRRNGEEGRVEDVL